MTGSFFRKLMLTVSGLQIIWHVIIVRIPEKMLDISNSYAKIIKDLHEKAMTAHSRGFRSWQREGITGCKFLSVP